MSTAEHAEVNRRDFLYIATGAVGAVGAALTAWPFIAQMNPDASVRALASVEVDLAPIAFVGDTAYPTVSVDSGGVHWNSTVLSHAFYLAIEGGANATSGIAVQGVGSANRAEIERVFFRAMTVLMPEAPNVAMAAAALRQAAADLSGGAAAARAVSDALTAVGLP